MQRRSDDGFSLIEVLGATAIFVAGAASIAQLATVAIAANLGARARTEAALLASQKVEELLALPWGTEASAADQREGYARTWEVRPLPLNPQSAVTIEVRVAHVTRGDGVRLLAVKVRPAP